MKKIKNEAALVNEAIRVGSIYVQKRGFGQIDNSDSATAKIRFIYHALVRDKLIQPLAKDHINHANMRHKLALWMSRQLPKGHALLQ